MQVILLEKVGKWGNIGSVVAVKDGYARNYLLPRNKAIRATKANLEYFEQKKVELEKQNAEKKVAAEKIAEKINGISVVLIRQAGEDGRLYGSVTSRDIARLISDKSKVDVPSEAIHIANRIKELGIHTVEVALHADVKAQVSLNIARSDDEAKAKVAAASKGANKQDDSGSRD